MEEKELTQRFYQVFEDIAPILEDIKKGFFAQKESVLRECKAKFKSIIKSRVSFAEKIVEEKDKDEIEKRYTNLFLSFQPVALAIENMINKMETKIESKTLFSEKALSEIAELFNVMQSQFRDTQDYTLTKNPHLKNDIDSGKEKLTKIAEDYELIHQERLIAGVCMPKASYLYIDITDSLKRIARGLADFSAKV